MGGLGSGRFPSQGRKQTVEESMALSIGLLQRQGLCVGRRDIRSDLSWANCAIASVRILTKTLQEPRPRLRLLYDVATDNGVMHIDKPVELVATALAHNACRWWFQCPACGRRCGVLYLPPGQRFFACRRCHDLVYASQQFKTNSRAFRPSLLAKIV